MCTIGSFSFTLFFFDFFNLCFFLNRFVNFGDNRFYFVFRLGFGFGFFELLFKRFFLYGDLFAESRNL